MVEELGKQSEATRQIEEKLGRHLIRAYELPTEVARVDTTSFSVNHHQLESEEESSILRYGHSKDKRLKRGSLPALPIYFQNQDRITGLMFLLNLALRVFTLMEFVVQQALLSTQTSLTGLYDGNPKRKTARPSAEQMLNAFCHLTLYFLPDFTIFVTPINDLQRQILSLMKMPESLYQLDSKLCKT